MLAILLFLVHFFFSLLFLFLLGDLLFFVFAFVFFLLTLVVVGDLDLDLLEPAYST